MKAVPDKSSSIDVVGTDWMKDWAACIERPMRTFRFGQRQVYSEYPDRHAGP
jgi:hypothetical protein